jgi:hypothetical protein
MIDILAWWCIGCAYFTWFNITASDMPETDQVVGYRRLVLFTVLLAPLVIPGDLILRVVTWTMSGRPRGLYLALDEIKAI